MTTNKGGIKKKIVLISSGQPALNPRLVKEADSLAAAGYEVTVLYAYWNEWGTEMDNKLLRLKKWTAVRAGGDPHQKKNAYFFSRLINKLGVLITNKTGNLHFADFAISRSSYFLIREAKKHPADLYIGHNLGALPATVKAAKFYKKPCGFDAEDFHRYETSDDEHDYGVILKSHIEDKYIPQLDYFSSSSPQISAAYGKRYHISPLTLLNVFPASNGLTGPTIATGPVLKLFWFSQTVSLARGVGDCVGALKMLNNSRVELHLLGSASEKFKEQLIADAGDNVHIKFHQPVSPDDIIPLAAQFDIGLALEDNIPLNRDICLTNKIFSYMQAGLAIVATDTTAQQALMHSYPGIGKVYEKGNIQALANIINHYFNNPEDLNKAKVTAFKVAESELNWEKESEKFLAMIKNILPL